MKTRMKHLTNLLRCSERVEFTIHQDLVTEDFSKNKKEIEDAWSFFSYEDSDIDCCRINEFEKEQIKIIVKVKR